MELRKTMLIQFRVTPRMKKTIQNAARENHQKVSDYITDILQTKVNLKNK